jgi:hypothetical protein
MGLRTVVAEQNSCGCDIQPVRDIRYNILLHQRTPRAAKWAVRGDMNTPCLAKVYRVLLWQLCVIFNLVYRRDYGGVGKQFLQKLHTIVTDADRFDFASFEKSLHCLPGLDVCPVFNHVDFSVGKSREAFIVAYLLSVS